MPEVKINTSASHLFKVRKILNNLLDKLRNETQKQDLKCGLVLILKNELLSYSPDELRDAGVKDVAKAVTQPIRWALEKALPEVELYRDKTKQSQGRVSSRFYFIQAKPEDIKQLSIEYPE